MPDLKSLGLLSGEWFFLLTVEEPTKTAFQLGENISECGVGIPGTDSPRASSVKLLTPTALKPKHPRECLIKDVIIYRRCPITFLGLLELIENFQSGAVAGEVVEVEPPRHTNRVPRYLSGKRRRNTEMVG